MTWSEKTLSNLRLLIIASPQHTVTWKCENKTEKTKSDRKLTKNSSSIQNFL